jgi:hypothetical protein
MPIITVKLEGERYIAHFGRSGAIAARVEGAGFHWDPVKFQWWTTDPEVIRKFDPDIAHDVLSNGALSGSRAIADAWLGLTPEPAGRDRGRLSTQPCLSRSRAPPLAKSRTPQPRLQVTYELWETGWECPESDDALQPLTAQLRSILASRMTKNAPTENRDPSAIGPGWVYVLSNKAHPHLVKIGYSTDAPESRAAEISASTGVPFPFIVEFKIYVEECSGIEAAVHNDLRDFRRNLRREFFEISIDNAARAITKLAAENSASSSTLIAYVRENGELYRIDKAEIVPISKG